MGLFSEQEMELYITKCGWEDGTVYYAREDRGNGDEERHVIGHSNGCPYNRLRSGYKPASPLVLVAVEPGSESLERSRQARFRGQLVRGTTEWFHPSKMLVEHEARLLEKHGLPRRTNANGRKLCIKRLEAFPSDLVLAVLKTHIQWYDEGKHPGSDKIYQSYRPEHDMYMADFRAHWCGTVGKDVGECPYGPKEINAVREKARKIPGRGTEKYEQELIRVENVYARGEWKGDM